MRSDVSAAVIDRAIPASGLDVVDTIDDERESAAIGGSDLCRLSAPMQRSRGGDATLSPLVRRVICHLEDNYLNPSLLRDLARALNKSRFQLIRSFRREMHTTPHAYLIKLRVAHAIHLLQRGETIAQVAAATGLSDQSHLTRHFKRWTGTTPGAFTRTRSLALAS